MHLLAAQPGTIADGSVAVDLDQSPADIVVLSAADTELACLAAARDRLNDYAFPSLRLASLLHLHHPLSVDLYLDKTVQHARLVIVRLLGGRGYWSYGVERLAELAHSRGIDVALLPGDDQPDPDLISDSTLPAEAVHRLWRYLAEGGVDNAGEFLKFAASLIGWTVADWREPYPFPHAGLYWPGLTSPTLADLASRWPATAPRAALIFYRALVQAGNLKAIDALIDGLEAVGLAPLPLFVTSLKDPLSAAILARVFTEAKPTIVLNGTGFAAGTPGEPRASPPFPGCDGPVLQVIFAGSTEAAWREGTCGLLPRDIAMNVALPEVDGRIIARAVSFKGLARRDAATETDIVSYEPVPDRVAFVCRLAANWVRLRTTHTTERRVALILANYPNRDGRIGNGVGLDTPASVVAVLNVLQKAGYLVENIPISGNALIDRLTVGPTNAWRNVNQRRVEETLPLADYLQFFESLPAAVRGQVLDRWGAPETDPSFLPNKRDRGRFAIPAFRCGNIAVCLQPARGYNIDPQSSYHDPGLVPPHGYLAFYAWLATSFGAHAAVHFGKHGNLEWLPGKSVALSSACFPEAALGPLPHLYPFIVNDPGEGTQAKRRAQAVIVDHLTPPLTRAESYGPLKALEQLVDEYYEAAQVDPRRVKLLRRNIIELCQSSGLDKDCGIAPHDHEDEALSKLDRFLCELKELQIRDGLHVFGVSPEGRQERDLLVALTRLPRGTGRGGEASLLRALANDLALEIDPLAGDPSIPWDGPRPACLADDAPWRTRGDTIERLEGLAARLVEGSTVPAPEWKETRAVLDWIETTLRPLIQACGAREFEGLLGGLGGHFVPAGPSGAPTRGRPDVLPTGRNFYSIDTRSVPTPAAWSLGWASAALVVERYVQDHGDWPKRMALTAWGTSNMRTGGDDVAQALALMGVRPTWDNGSCRVTGFEILPLAVLARPRVDVTLRISGFFRDAFPNLIDLFDSAVRAVAALDENETDNPLAAKVRHETTQLRASGETAEVADRLAGVRVFGSKPGAYGAGLQALIDEKGWTTDADFARAYLTWGSYAYGNGLNGVATPRLFRSRLEEIQAVLHNQDNREHDILDSDDYYQFEGGLTATVRVLSGAQPAVYHGDHARPEAPAIRTLEEEVARVVRSRVVNPKWIAGVMRHGYKGAFEMAATVDYLFAFAATARCVANHHFDAVYEAYVGDETVRGFLNDNNPAALTEMSERLLEAEDRGLWRPTLNSAHEMLCHLAKRDREA